MFHVIGSWKRAGVAMVFVDKVNFKPRLIKRDKEDHYILVKGTIQEEEITIINRGYRSSAGR